MAQKSEAHTCMILVYSYFALFFVNGLVVYLASMYFPANVVLGTLHIPKLWAVIHSMGALALINTFAIPVLRAYERSKDTMVTNRDWIVAYFFINFGGIWIITRFADQLGFGITSWVIALVLAAILDAFQGVVMMQLEKYRTNIG